MAQAPKETTLDWLQTLEEFDFQQQLRRVVSISIINSFEFY